MLNSSVHTTFCIHANSFTTLLWYTNWVLYTASTSSMKEWDTYSKKQHHNNNNNYTQMHIADNCRESRLVTHAKNLNTLHSIQPTNNHRYIFYAHRTLLLFCCVIFFFNYTKTSWPFVRCKGQINTSLKGVHLVINHLIHS